MLIAKLNPSGFIIQRCSSTLAEKLARVSDVTIKESPEMENLRIETETDETNEPFRELFLKPKRKLQSQLTFERMTGRAEVINYSKADVLDRMAIRSPRKEEMPTDQDWTSVWPAAQSFRSSVVPLPVRMGYSKIKNGKPIRPPFKTEGNLELVKIPNFLHLTPEHIKKHCKIIKQFCTEFPKELKEDPSLIKKHLPVSIKYTDYIHQGTSLRDIRARIVTTQINLDDIKLSKDGLDKFRRLVSNRYDEKTNTFTLVTDRCYTRKQNREYGEYLLTVLYHESSKLEEWEKLKERADSWKVEFNGSPLEQKLMGLVEASKKEGTPLPIAQKLDEVSPEKLNETEEIKEFAKKWTDYRNVPETPQSAREYGDAVRSLLGLPKVTKPEKNLVEHK